MKKHLLSKIFLGLVTFAVCGVTLAETYKYSNLLSKSYDEMLSEVKKRVKTAEAINEKDEAMPYLKDALLLIFSRPDSDNMVSQLVPIVRTPLKNIESYDSVLATIASEATSRLAKGRGKAKEKATDIILLGNLMAEIKPDVKSNGQFKSIVEKIKKADLKVGSDVSSELRLNAMMKTPQSPSEIAAKILESSQ